MNAGQECRQAKGLKVYKFLCKCAGGFHIALISIWLNKAGPDNSLSFSRGKVFSSDFLYWGVWYLNWYLDDLERFSCHLSFFSDWWRFLTKICNLYNLKLLGQNILGSMFLLKLNLTLNKLAPVTKLVIQFFTVLVIKKLAEKSVKEAVWSVRLNYVV